MGHRECSKTVPVWTPFPRLGGSLVLPGDLVMAHGANATGAYGNVSLLHQFSSISLKCFIILEKISLGEL